ncbi:MAG: hypothetical protein ACXVPQ_01810 [Bacteroidia bacterium]
MKKEATAFLENLIREKERQRETEAAELRAHFHLTYESLRPVNIIKNTFNEIISDPDLKRSALDTAIGRASGMLSRRLLMGKEQNLITKLFGSLIETGISGLAAKNGAAIRSAASFIFEKVKIASNPGNPDDSRN